MAAECIGCYCLICTWLTSCCYCLCRVHAGKNGKTLAQLHEVIGEAPTTLKSSFNLGSADFYPATSGKVRGDGHGLWLAGSSKLRILTQN